MGVLWKSWSIEDTSLTLPNSESQKTVSAIDKLSSDMDQLFIADSSGPKEDNAEQGVERI